MSVISTINSTISNRINKKGSFYETFVGQDPFTPESVILESSDFNCGAISNELEFARTVSRYFVKSLLIEHAENEELEDLFQTFIDLPRRNIAETDDTYRRRFRAIVVEAVNPSRTTRWAIIDAVNYFINDKTKIQVIEPFDRSYPYFNIRFEGVETTEGVLTLNNTSFGFLDQHYMGGVGIGGAVSFVGEIIDRVRAAGVDYDVSFIIQNSTSLEAAAVIGAVQKYLESAATVQSSRTITVSSSAVVS